MYYIYFPYAALVAAWMLYECSQRNQPRWWAWIVFLSPVTTPYFIFKFRKESGIIIFMIFLTTFSAVGVSEFFLYLRYMKENRYADLPPVTLQMIRLSEDLKESTIQLDNALIKLENLSKVESRINEIKKTIEFIDTLRRMMTDNQQAIDRLVKYTRDYQGYFKKKELEWVFDVQRFYDNRNVIQHFKTLEKYLNSFQELLEYTYVNFYNITELKAEEYLRNYDEYYLRYRRAVDSHNLFNVRRIEFQNEFISKHPGVKPYLPGNRQTETFRLWE